MKRLSLALAATLALALVLAAAAIGQRRAEEAGLSPLPSVDNYGPAGLAAARAFLAQRGSRVLVDRWKEASPEKDSVRIVAGPTGTLSGSGIDGLLLGVSQGETLVWGAAVAPQPALSRKLEARLQPYPGQRMAAALAPHPLVDGLVLPVNDGSVSSSLPGALAIAGSRDSASILSVPWGRGEVLLLSGPEPFTNEHLAEGNALSFLTRLAERGPIVFDERWVTPHNDAPRKIPPLFAVFAQALLAGLVFVAARSRRLGIVRPPLDQERGRTARDYLRTLARLYGRAGAEADLARSALARARRTLERRTGLRAGLDDNEFESRLELRAPLARSAFARARSALLLPPGPAALLAVVRACADLEASSLRSAKGAPVKGPRPG